MLPGDDDPIYFGPVYQLLEPLGRGAMGEVWKGLHRSQGSAVAIKILTRIDALDARYEIGFREEVRAAASLDHPHIVTVYDYGRTDRDTADATNGRYPEGSPYLVMELVEGQSLRTLCGRLAWPTLYRLLLSLLDALGHAHARGLIHRDLKPHNVMVAPDGDRALVLKLTDFGLAHATRPEAANPFIDRMAGTPNYMAPEQVMVAWRDYGPWTDLYALGCLCHALVTGRPPFAGRGSRAILEAHLEEPPPPLLGDVPEGFCRWVDRLLEKDPERRFACAADATWALIKGVETGELPPLPGGAPTRIDLALLADPSAPLDSSLAVSVARHTLNWDLSELSRSASDSFLPGAQRPPVPSDWRRMDERSWNSLVGAGLGLWGMRTPRLVGRERECDRLWDLLGAVHGDGRPRGAVIEGPPGFGKTRLARWLTERAFEYGLAQILELSHSPQGSPSDGLAPGFARFHRCHGLDRGDATDRVGRILRTLGEYDEERWHQLGELLAEPEGAARPFSPRRRRAILLDHLRRLTRERPVILFIDDAQWADDALDFARAVLAETADLPVLCVLTSDGSAQVTGAERLILDPLAAEHMHALVAHLLGPVGDLAVQLEARAEGNPLFAIQLAGDWVQRGELVPGASGFRLATGVKPRLPDSVHAIWVDRLDALIGEAAQDRLALELAATLGNPVDAAEWAATCAQAGVEPTEDLVEALIEGGLARRPQRSAEGWAFAHGLLHQSVLRLADEGGRVAAHHRACAAALAAFSARPRVAERRARHLLEVGDRAAALEPLAQAIRARLKSGEHAPARALLDTWNGCVLHLELPPEDPRRATGWLLRCRIARRSGELARARQLAETAVAEGRRHGWSGMVAHTLVDLAWDAFNAGDLRLALDRLDESAALARQLDDESAQANALRTHGVMLLDRGDAPTVEALLSQSREISARQGHLHGEGLSLINLAQLARRHGRFSQALDWADQALLRFTADRSRWGQAMAQAERGLIHLLAGDLEAADADLQAAIARYQVYPGVNAEVASLSLAELRLVQGRRDEAWGVFASLRDKLGLQQRHGRTLIAVLGLLAVAAGDGDWQSFGEHLAQAQDLLQAHAAASRDGARLAERAAGGALSADQPARAAEAFALAGGQWRILGVTAEAERVEAERARALRSTGPDPGPP